MCVRISGTKHTAHDKKKGGSLQARRMLRRNYFTFDNGMPIVRLLRSRNIEARVPSLAVLEHSSFGTFHTDADRKNAAKDVMLKLDDSYQTFSKTLGDYQGPMTYNLLTSLQDIVDWNEQARSFSAIVHGAHLFNARQVSSGLVDSLFHVQNIPVNGHGAPLNYTAFVPTTREATLMSSMALIATLHRQRRYLPRAQREQVEVCHDTLQRAYISFLKKVPPIDHSASFENSRQGNQAKKHLDNYHRNTLQIRGAGSIESKSLQHLVTQALYRLHGENKLTDLKYGMLIQSLSVFIEQVSIAGCKSANERYAAVSGRVDLLKSINNRDKAELSDEEEKVCRLLASYATGSASIEKLRVALDIAYNQYNLNGAAASISTQDQGAGHKVEAHRSGERYFRSIHTSVAESAELTWHHAAGTSSLQAHKEDKRQAVAEAYQELDGVENPLPDISAQHTQRTDASPRIYGTLNNCLLHCAVPAILQEIRAIGFGLNGKTPSPEYLSLLKCFNDYYATQLDFRGLHQLLAVEGNDFSRQLMMGPVLRAFMGVNLTKMNPKDRPRGEHTDIALLTEVQANGRFDSLDSQDVLKTLYKPLGLNLQEYQHQPPGNDSWTEVEAVDFDSAKETLITVYHKGEHYELDKNKFGSLGDLELASELVQEQHTVITSNDTKAPVLTALEGMKGYFKSRADHHAQSQIVVDRRLLTSQTFTYEPPAERIDLYYFSETTPKKEKTAKKSMVIKSIHDKASRAIQKKKFKNILSWSDSKIIPVESKPKINLTFSQQVSEGLGQILGHSIGESTSELTQALETLVNGNALAKIQHMAHPAVHMLSPQKVEKYIVYLSQVSTFIDDETSQLTADISELEKQFSSKLAKSERGQQLLSQAQSQYLVLAKTELERYQSIKTNVSETMTSLVKGREGRATLKMGDKTTTIVARSELGSQLGVNVSSRPELIIDGGSSERYSACDTIPEDHVALHQWKDSKGEQQLEFIELASHNRVETVGNDLSRSSVSAQMELALNMIAQQLLNMDGLPHKDNELVISGKDGKLCEYGYGVACIFAKKLGFDKGGIRVRAVGFSPEKKSFLKGGGLKVKDDLNNEIGTLIDSFVSDIGKVVEFKKKELAEDSVSLINESLQKFITQSPRN